MKQLRARIAIFVRTKDRPLFLKRALQSIAAQTYQDFVVLLLDSGTHGGVDSCIQFLSPSFRSKIKVLPIGQTENSNLGTLNQGLSCSESEFFAIHDDDDSWEPSFLQKSISLLEMRPESGASVTKIWEVREQILEGKIETIGKSIYNDWQGEHISFFRLAESLTFAPIGMLVRRSSMRLVGGFRSDLPVMSDWEFCLRLFSRLPVACLAEPLASYHFHGENSSLVAIKNRLYESVGIGLANDLLRKDLVSGRFGMGFVVSLSQAHGSLFRELLDLEQALAQRG